MDHNTVEAVKINETEAAITAKNNFDLDYEKIGREVGDSIVEWLHSLDYSDVQIQDIVDGARNIANALDSDVPFSNALGITLEDIAKEHDVEIPTEDTTNDNNDQTEAKGTEKNESDNSANVNERDHAGTDTDKTEKEPDAYETAKETFEGLRDKYLFRNTFVTASKLDYMIEARKAGKPGPNGRAVSGGDIAMCIIELTRGNILDSLLEVAIRAVLDEMFPPKDIDSGTTKDEGKDTATNDQKEKAVDPRDRTFVKDMSGTVRDDGYVSKPFEKGSSWKDLGINDSNPSKGVYMGVDMTREPHNKGDFVVRNSGAPVERTVIKDGATDVLKIPSVRLVEVHGNDYLVDPFGKILWSDISRNPESRIEGRIPQLSVEARPADREKLDTLANNEGVSLDTLKETISQNAMEKYSSKVMSGVEKHAEYIEKTALPETKETIEAYKEKLSVVESRIDQIDSKLSDLDAKVSAGTFTEDDHHKEVDLKMEKSDAVNIKEKLTASIEKAETRRDNLEGTLERYNTDLNAYKSGKVDNEGKRSQLTVQKPVQYQLRGFWIQAISIKKYLVSYLN